MKTVNSKINIANDNIILITKGQLSNKDNIRKKEICLSQYDKNVKFVSQEAMECCKMDTAKLSKDVRVEITNTNGKAKATIVTTVDGKPTTQTFEGTEAEVRAKVDAVK